MLRVKRKQLKLYISIKLFMRILRRSPENIFTEVDICLFPQKFQTIINILQVNFDGYAWHIKTALIVLIKRV